MTPLPILTRTVLVGLFVSLAIASCSKRKVYNVRNCSSVWNGTFVNMRNGEVDTNISRTGDVQIERFKNGTVTNFKVEWLDSCQYRLTPVYGNEPDSTKDIRPVIVQITAVKEDSYTIEGWIEGSYTTVTSEMFKTR